MYFLLSLLTALPVLPGGVISKTMKGIGFSPSHLKSYGMVISHALLALLTNKCFSARYNPYHVLRRPNPKLSFFPWKRTHNLTLPTDVNAVMKQNFVFIMLLRDIY